MKKLVCLFIAIIMCLALSSCSGDTSESPWVKYDEIVRLLEEGEYDRAIYEIEQLKNAPQTDENGSIIETELSQNQMDNLYSSVKSFLDGYDPGYLRTSPYRVFDHRTEQNLEFNGNDEIFTYYAGIIADLGDYKDADSLLDRIYEHDNVLLHTQTTYTDAFGAEHSEVTSVLVYDRNGNVVQKSNSSHEYSYHGLSLFTAPYIEYDADGNATKATFMSGETVHAIIEYVYENGRLVSETSKSSNGDGRTISYTYDAEGRVAEKSGVYSSYSSDGVTVKYEYNDKGLLVREYFVTEDEYSSFVTYEYSGDGKLITKKKSAGSLRTHGANEQEYGKDTTVWDYAYDDEGRISTVTERDLGYLNSKGEQVDYTGDPEDDPDLDFDRITVYTYGTFYGVEKDEK